ncbi:MAG: NADPH-dependent 7-cyano-7-deazaguanine reductase QueF [Gammaproteobacteria bacterium]|nr:NADPH-dependent 7-cyano-7-deazaguanine reductase QueF [Gammaproteobacteria bacterium]
MLQHSPLGKKSEYDVTYNPQLLFPISRKTKRDEIGVPEPLPFYGVDLWHHYEVSWLNEKGKPVCAIAEISYPCESPNIIESKSMKLYFNSLNQTAFKNEFVLQEIITQDLSERVGAKVVVLLYPLQKNQSHQNMLARLPGIYLDELDIDCHVYQPDRALLKVEKDKVEETLSSDLLKSNCLVTGQPDWGSVQIQYRGQKINHESVLRYIVSFRNHNEFHEQCIERIFMDIQKACQPELLTVYGRYTRRGGLDINPFRTTEKDVLPNNDRLIRQ